MSRAPHAVRSRGPQVHSWLALAAAIGIAGCQERPAPTEPELEADLPSMTASVQEADVGPDDWIVVFKKGTHDPPGLARRLTADHGGTVRHTYELALQGFAGTIPPQAIEGIRRNPNVEFVERDGIATASEVASWGLDRIDQRTLPLDDSYAPAGTGAGVDAWIIDTGVDYTRTDEFGDRFDTTRDYDFISNDDDASDCAATGHGTHVAGTVGSLSYGVAKGVTIIGVRVLGCSGSGSYSGIIAGIEHVVQHMDGPTVANMSLGGGVSSSLNLAVKNAVDAGVVMAVAAGNDGIDACLRSPASAPEAITVGATMSNDARSNHPGWWSSNYGSCVDLFAPGSAITSTVVGGGSESWYGTSMATPHVAGAAALILEADPSLTAYGVWAKMQADATSGVVSDTRGSPNRLLYVAPGSAPPPPPPCETNCDALVRWISDVSVQVKNGGRANGTVTVQIVDENGPLPGVTVHGDWNLNLGDAYRTSTGITDAEGMVEFSTGTIKNATSFEFCVTSLAADGYGDGSTGAECSPHGTPWVGTEPPPPPPGAGAPSDLSALKVSKGKNWRVELDWTGGAGSVSVTRNEDVIATISNGGSYIDQFGKSPMPGTYVYRVCNAGTSDCSGTASITF